MAPGASPALPAACLPGQGRDLGALPPHTRVPIPARRGKASMLAGTRRARPNVASPGAQTWPAGRVRAALCILLGVPRGGGCGTALGPGSGCLAMPEGWWGGRVPGVSERWGSRSSPGEPGLGRERWEVSVQRGCHRPCHPEPAGSGEAHAGKLVQLAQHLQGHGPGGPQRRGGSVPTHVAVPMPSGWASGRWGWRSGGGRCQAAHVLPDAAARTAASRPCGSMAAPRWAGALGAGRPREEIPGEMLFAQNRRSPAEVGTQGQG